ncbi:MAG: hypothetical protein HY097_03525 [Nitrospinae bacterium]|nr:hypothetical protein [Nitrospinota bacterium]
MPETYDYTYGYFLFHRIGKNLTVNMTSDFDKAVNVAFWVFDHIKQFDHPQQARFMPVIDDNFLNIYRRGFGYCDQGAHVYATMMHWLGFESKLLMLRKEDGVSPHTVAVVKVNGKFMVVDTSYKFIFVDDKRKPVGVDELEGSEIFDEYLKVVKAANIVLKIKEPVEIKPSYFRNGTYFETFPYCSWRHTFKKVIQKLIH